MPVSPSNETQPAADIDSQLRFLERFIPDNFLPLESFLGGCKGSIANHSPCLKMPYNRFLKLEFYFHIATKGNSLLWFVHHNELEMCVSSSASLSKHFIFVSRNHKMLFGAPDGAVINQV